MNLDLNKILEQVCNSATEIGGYLKTEQSKLKATAVEMKGLRDYVSYVDKEAEKQLVSALKNLIPNAGFLTEEDTVEQEEKDYTWIIDPLDGTSNYVHGLAPYNVSIALVYKKETILGVVYDPLANEMFTAIKGEKALLNNEPIDVSKKDELKNSFIGFGIPYEMDTNTAAILKNTWEHFGQASFRLNGAAALELCFVACGRYDAFFHSGLSPWDVAAGAFILQQAGGKITDYNNGHNYIFGKEVVATNSLIHTDIMKNIINLNKAD
jgi:myo-inositol-1(or 4)-monophosphatase